MELEYTDLQQTCVSPGEQFLALQSLAEQLWSCSNLP